MILVVMNAIFAIVYGSLKNSGDTGIAKVTGSNPVEVLNFSGFQMQLQKLRL